MQGDSQFIHDINVTVHSEKRTTSSNRCISAFTPYLDHGFPFHVGTKRKD